MDLESERGAVKAVSIEEIADAIQAIGFECTRCGACCKGHGDEHTATVFPDEIRDIQARDEYEWRDVARPMPYGLTGSGDGETIEWALQTDDCGDCTFYDESGARGECTVYEDRPLICRTYPFSLGGITSADGNGGILEPMGEEVDKHGPVVAHECEGLGQDISREDAETLAHALKRRALQEIEEAMAIIDGFESTNDAGAVVHDSEGAKRPDGTLID